MDFCELLVGPPKRSVWRRTNFSLHCGTAGKMGFAVACLDLQKYTSNILGLKYYLPPPPFSSISSYRKSEKLIFLTLLLGGYLHERAINNIPGVPKNPFRCSYPEGHCSFVPSCPMWWVCWLGKEGIPLINWNCQLGASPSLCFSSIVSLPMLQKLIFLRCDDWPVAMQLGAPLFAKCGLNKNNNNNKSKGIWAQKSINQKWGGGAAGPFVTIKSD